MLTISRKIERLNSSFSTSVPLQTSFWRPCVWVANNLCHFHFKVTISNHRSKFKVQLSTVWLTSSQFDVNCRNENVSQVFNQSWFIKWGLLCWPALEPQMVGVGAVLVDSWKEEKLHLQTYTLHYLIRVHVRLFILAKKSCLYKPIWCIFGPFLAISLVKFAYMRNKFVIMYAYSILYLYVIV